MVSSGSFFEKGFCQVRFAKAHNRAIASFFINHAKFISGKCTNLLLGIVPCTLSEPRAMGVFK